MGRSEFVFRCLALRDPTLPHPGIPLLLLDNFAPLCVEDDLEVYFLIERSARWSVGIIKEDDVYYDGRIGRMSYNDVDYSWKKHDQFGWTLYPEPDEGDDRLDSIRITTCDFPFDDFNRLVEEAQGYCAEVVRPLREWKQGLVVDLTRAIVKDLAFEHLPILADALEESGYNNQTILDSCRRPGDLMRIFWFLVMLLGEKWDWMPDGFRKMANVVLQSKPQG